jgi:hypothetical protein
MAGGSVTRAAWPPALAAWAAVVTQTAPHPSPTAIATAARRARRASHAHWEATGEGLLRPAVRATCPWTGAWAQRIRPDGEVVLKTGDCPWCGMTWRAHR